MFLNEGVHVLVEKPLALELGHADELIRLAGEKNLVLQVGHQERYIIEGLGMFARDAAPVMIESQRAGPYTGRGSDVCAVLDLMIHDLDIIHQMMASEVRDVTATAKSLHSAKSDEVKATLTFEDGATADILASRISPDRRRSLRVTYPDGEIEIDFLGRVLRNTTKAPLPASFEQMNGHAYVLTDPLGYGIQSFLESIRDGLPPRISGTEARRALQTALRITERLAA
jgi:predicted dehydrogenase